MYFWSLINFVQNDFPQKMSFSALKKHIFFTKNAIFTPAPPNSTLVSRNFFSCRGGPEDSKTPPTCKICMILSQVMAHPKKQCFDFPSLNLQSKLFWENFIFFKLPQLGPKLFKLYRLGVFWNPHDLLLMMGTEIFKIDASWAEKLTKTRVSFLTAPTVL